MNLSNMFYQHVHPELRRIMSVVRLIAAGIGVAALPANSNAAPVDLILDFGSPGQMESGTWMNATSASQHHGSMSRYAVAGGALDAATYRPTLPESGLYEVLAWNSFYENRATQVPHRIVHRNGITTIAVDQSGTGTYGEWFSLGWYEFDAGNGGFVEISDAGLSTSRTTYIGADAVRFIKPDEPPPPPPPPPPPIATFDDGFDEDVTPLDSSYATYNAEALPIVGKKAGRYYAEVRSNVNNVTVHYNTSQGRIDAQLASFPFEVIARNMGIGQVEATQNAPSPEGSAYLLAGIIVHVLELASPNSAFVAVGHRGISPFTIEGKNTRNGVSTVTDLGPNQVPLARADLRVVGTSEGTLLVYWQHPNPDPGTQPDNWQPYGGTGALPGPAPDFGAQVYIGLITFASGDTGLPFVGTADSFHINEG